MKRNPKDSSSRRKFLSLGLLGGAGLFAQKAEAMTALTEDDEKVSMLTADGKLVEVSKKILDQSTNREAANNKKILNWADATKKSMP